MTNQNKRSKNKRKRNQNSTPSGKGKKEHDALDNTNTLKPPFKILKTDRSISSSESERDTGASTDTDMSFIIESSAEKTN